MTVWTIALGFVLGKMLFNFISWIMHEFDDAITRKMDEKYPNWREKKHGNKVTPKEPIGFKQNMIES